MTARSTNVSPVLVGTACSIVSFDPGERARSALLTKVDSCSVPLLLAIMIPHT